MLVGLYEEPERPPNAVDYIKRYACLASSQAIFRAALLSATAP